jgi:hypothetical protein
VEKRLVDPAKFNPAARLPYELRRDDFQIAMQDVFDFFLDVNELLSRKGLPRLDQEHPKERWRGGHTWRARPVDVRVRL